MQIRTDRKFEDIYDVFEDLGSGQFAIVRRCKEKSTQIEYAAKFVVKRRPNSSSRKGLFREKILQEIEILSELKHNNIISLHEVFETQYEIILVLELVKGGELFEFISEKDHLSESDAAKFITQILEGVEHFHARNIVHLDLKPENVMLLDRQNCLIKIIDFGISRKLKPGEKVMETYGTPEFVAPEIIQYQPISTATDMWSIGVITYILLSGASPFLGDSKQETFANITNIDYSFDDEYFGHTSDLAKDFIARLFVKDVRKRATVKDCLEHPWIKPRRKQDEDLRRQAQINIEQFKSFIARRRWKQSALAVLIANRIIKKFQFRLSSTLSLDNINCVSFGKSLLDNGDNFVLTALLCASEDGDYLNLKNLLNVAHIDVNTHNQNKETALHIAALNGRLDIIKLLNEFKINLNATDINGENAIHFSCRSNDIENSKYIIQYLIKNGVPIDVQNKNGETPLHVASRYGCIELVRVLCDLGANLDIQDDQLETCLHVASWNIFPEIVKCLCNYGCDVNMKNKDGETCLIVACARGCIDIVKTLTEHKADLNYRDNRRNTALHWAVKRHYTLIALLLIQAGCNMDLLDSNGESALHIACRENLLPVVQTMCALGCRVDIKNKKEMTPLHTATEKNEIDAVRCLCLAGLDLSIKNKDGLTAEQLAINLKHNNIANLLSSLRREENREMFIEQLVPTNDVLRKIKLKVFGSSGVGKSTLIDSMNCSYLNSFFRKTRLSTNVTPNNKAQKNYGLHRNYLEKINSFSSQELFDMNNMVNQEQDSLSSVNNILDNYEPVNKNYTQGINITQSTFFGSHHFSIWEFSGYEPYQQFYDQFIKDLNSIYLIVYSLNQEQDDCFKQCINWLEYLRSRIKINQHEFKPNSIKILFVATHADLDKNYTHIKKDDGQYTNEKSIYLKQQIENYYKNDDMFDLSEKHFVLDARSAWVTDTKLLIQHLIKLKESLGEKLPKCTMFLNRTLFHIQNWRKLLISQNSNVPPSSPISSGHKFNFGNFQNPSYPILTWKQFVDQIREQINPLASDDHLCELKEQLEIMGEIVYIKSNHETELICYQPEWLCNKILGRLFSHERYLNIKPSNFNGVYTLSELKEIFSDLCCDLNLLKDLFISFDLCAEYEDTNSLLYEFSALNFITEPVPYCFNIIKNYKQKNLFILNGFRLKLSNFHFKTQTSLMTSSMINSFTQANLIKCPSQLASLFFRIQVFLRFLNSSLEENVKKETKSVKKLDTKLTDENFSKLDRLLMDDKVENSNNSSYPNTTNSTINILQSSKFNNLKLETKLNGALIDFDLSQTRYCSRLTRKSCLIECLLSLDHLNGDYIELRACAPEAFREELFYFIQDLYSLIEHLILETCPNINLEKHYLSFRPIKLAKGVTNLGVIPFDLIYSPKDLIQMEMEKDKKSKLDNLFIDLICCGSENIKKNLTYGIDLGFYKINPYSKRMLCCYLDKTDPMGRDWSILAFLLGLQDFLPLIDSSSSKINSKCELVLNEWCKIKPEQATIKNLLNKIREMGRRDVYEMLLNSIHIYQTNLSKDSGIQNSNQTLASIK